jgi:hypothetical protein
VRLSGLQNLNFKTLILSLVLGMLLILVDFSDSWISGSIGNLDQIFGANLWHPLEIIYSLASITVFLLFGRACFVSGKKEDESEPISKSMKSKALAIFVV